MELEEVNYYALAHFVPNLVPTEGVEPTHL